MKKSKYIDLSRLRKQTPYFQLRRIAIAVAAFSIVACSQKEEVKIVGSVEDCERDTTLTLEECTAAYERALAEAEKTGPKYRDRRLCEADFGYNACQERSSGIFMPLMAGFIVGRLFDGGRGYVHNPVFEYRNPYSNNRDRLMTADGSVLGRPGQSSYKVDRKAMKPKPKVSKTISRGGFGSKASAKSSWGGGKSRGSWGG